MNSSVTPVSSFALAEQIANAVLYEGYILYPYRPSSVKNRQRWTFGGLYPQPYSQAQGEPDSWQLQTECLVVGSADTTLAVKARFLHLLWREVGELKPPAFALVAPLDFHTVESLTVGDKVYHTWQEAIERTVDLAPMRLSNLVTQPYQQHFAYPASQTTELLPRTDGLVVGVIVRQQQAISGVVEASAEQMGDQLYKVTVKIMNLTPLAAAEQATRDTALLCSFVSTHAILQVDAGAFVSLIDPPATYAATAATCRNIGAYPVLVGEAGAGDLMLASPIILYDYPEIAPESAGDLFDGTEIDEILTLRILTMTDAEKQEMRQVDERAKALLDRTEALPAEQLMKLHGTMRTRRPWEM